MKGSGKEQEKIQKYSIRKLSVGVGSVAIAALIFGGLLAGPVVNAAEVGDGGAAQYSYIGEQELTDQEKSLIKQGLPSNLQTGENYYLIYRKQDEQTVLPHTGNKSQPLLGLFAGTAILAVLVFSRKKSGKLLGVLLLGSLGQAVLQSPQAFALENKELLSYNRQVAVSSTISESDIAVEGYDYIGYFTATDLRNLTGDKPSLPLAKALPEETGGQETETKDSSVTPQPELSEAISQQNTTAGTSGQDGQITSPTPSPSPDPQPVNPGIETAKGDSQKEVPLPEYTGGLNGESVVQEENPVHTKPVGTAGDTAPVEPALPEYTGGVNGESVVQADNPVYDAPVATVSDTVPVEPAVREYTGGVNGESAVQTDNPVYDA